MLNGLIERHESPGEVVVTKEMESALVERIASKGTSIAINLPLPERYSLCGWMLAFPFITADATTTTISHCYRCHSP